VCRRVLVSGRVQGVGFRASCALHAGQLGLAGFARNLGDGRVEAVVQGRPDAVDAFVAWCRVGPQLARVTSVAVSEEAVGRLVGFSVRS